MGKNQIERIMEIDRRIRAERYPGRKEIADLFEVSIKTIERDLEYMKYRLNAPIEYKRSRKGYYYTHKGFYIPTFYMSEGDALYLFMSHYLGVEWNREPFSSLGDEAMRKLSQLFPDSIEIDPLTFSSNIELVGRRPARPEDADIWMKLLQGAAHHRKVIIHYKPPGYDKPFSLKIYPYKLINHNRTWFISSIAEYLKELRTYSLNRIVSAELLKEPFPKNENMDPLKGMDKNFGIYHEAEPFTISIKTTKDVRDMIFEELSEYTWKPDQGNAVIISFTTNQYHEALYWLLKWGKNIEVLEPQQIRKELLEIGKSFLSLYSP